MKILPYLLILIATLSNAQVGIGTTTPQAAFETVSTTDGMLIPRIALTNTSTATILTPTKSEIIYNTATAGDVTPGYYYWETTPVVATDRWVRLANTSDDDWKETGNSGTIAGTNYIGTNDAQDLRFKTNSTDRLNLSNATGQLQSYFSGTVGAPAFSWNADSDTGVLRPAADNLSLATTGVERFRINDLGKIGINFPPQTFAQTFSYSNDATYDALVGYSDIAGGLGVYGRSIGAGSAGIFGTNNDDSGYGVYGSNSQNGLGVFGITSGTTDGVGVQGQSGGANGVGVIGFATTATAATATTIPVGVLGQSNAAGGIGTYGSNSGAGGIGIFGNASGAAATDSGAAVYGSINQATTGNQDVAAVIGLNSNFTQGSGFAGPNTLATASSIVGVSGAAVSKNTTNPSGGGAKPQNYHFGIMGETLIDSSIGGAQIQRRSGGVMGISLVGVFGILGYKTSGNVDIGGYFSSEGITTPGVDTGKFTSESKPYGGIGIGAVGGVMGGYIKGQNYGFIAKGKDFGAYIMGNTITNKPIAQIETVNNQRIVSYASTSTSIDINSRGKGQLINGEGYVAFEKIFADLADLTDENLNITITAKGNTNGIYIDRVTKDGFYVKENMNGNHNVTFNYSAVTTRKGYEKGMEISTEILEANWEKNMDDVMFNENNTNSSAKPIHFDGTKVKFEDLPSGYSPEARKAAPSKDIKSVKPSTNEISNKEKQIVKDEENK